MTESVDAAAKRWLDDFARGAESRETLDHLVSVVDDRIIEGLPEFLDPILREELHASTRSHWKGFLTVVTREHIEVTPAPQIHDLARTLARRGFELPFLLSVYRIGQRAVWHYITDALQTRIADPALRSTVLLQFWSHVSYWIDSTVEALIVTFTEEREQWQRGALARRAATVDAILAGHAVDVDTATTRLSYPLRQHHTAFTVRVEEKVPDSDVQQLIETTARTVSDSLGGATPLTISRGSRAGWCWTAAPTPAGPPALERLVRELPGRVRVTTGLCHPGVDGFRISHNEAVAALTVADRNDDVVTRFEDVEIACLAAGILDIEARNCFVQRELLNLTGSDEASQRLRETLQVYLRLGGDASATGAILRLHPNTVRYRIRQAEKRIGHSMQQRRIQTELALEIIRVLGDAG